VGGTYDWLPWDRILKTKKSFWLNVFFFFFFFNYSIPSISKQA
jgi:hypothetical protein